MKAFRILRQVQKSTGFNKFALSFLIFFLLIASIIHFIEPGSISFFDAIWFCFSAVTTIGFGDVTVTLTISKILTILLAIYGIVFIAVFTGTIVNFFSELQRVRAKDSISQFMDKLEVLPDLSEEELRELSVKVKQMRRDSRVV